MNSLQRGGEVRSGENGGERYWLRVLGAEHLVREDFVDDEMEVILTTDAAQLCRQCNKAGAENVPSLLVVHMQQ